MKPEATIDPIVAKVFPRCARDNFKRARTYARLLTAERLKDWEEYGDPGRQHFLEWLPNNLALILPADPRKHQWPYNFLYWVYPWVVYAADKDPTIRYLLPLMRAESELTIEEYEPLLRDHEIRDDILHEIIFEISTMAGNVVRHLAPTRDIQVCIEEVVFWQRYMTNAAGCFDENGEFDREKACVKALRTRQAWS